MLELHDIFHGHSKGTVSAKALNLSIQQDKSTSDMENKNRSTRKVFLSSAATVVSSVVVHDARLRKKALDLAGNFDHC